MNLSSHRVLCLCVCERETVGERERERVINVSHLRGIGLATAILPLVVINDSPSSACFMVVIQLSFNELRWLIRSNELLFSFSVSSSFFVKFLSISNFFFSAVLWFNPKWQEDSCFVCEWSAGTNRFLLHRFCSRPKNRSSGHFYDRVTRHQWTPLQPTLNGTDFFSPPPFSTFPILKLCGVPLEPPVILPGLVWWINFTISCFCFYFYVSVIYLINPLVFIPISRRGPVVLHSFGNHMTCLLNTTIVSLAKLKTR